jgi:outer membrane protein assembly factor BamA
LLHFSKRLRWFCFVLAIGSVLGESVRAESPGVSSSSTPALGSLAIPTEPSVASTATYSVPVSSPSPADADHESKRVARLAHILKIGAEGNKNVRERVILAQVKTKKNDVYDPDKLRKDVQAIYGLGSFEDVSLDVSDVPGGVLVLFKVIEKPVIKKIDFKGNKKVGSSKLRDGISLK